MATTWRSKRCSVSSMRSSTCDNSERTAETSFFMALSRLSNMEASSVLVGSPLTSAATSAHLGELSPPSELTEEAGDQCLGSGLYREKEPALEPVPHGEWPRPSVSVMFSGSAARKHLVEPVEVFSRSLAHGD